MSRIEEDGRKWLRWPKLCTKSCRAVLRRSVISSVIHGTGTVPTLYAMKT